VREGNLDDFQSHLTNSCQWKFSDFSQEGDSNPEDDSGKAEIIAGIIVGKMLFARFFFFAFPGIEKKTKSKIY
jgi:hypothetical protein